MGPPRLIREDVHHISSAHHLSSCVRAFARCGAPLSLHAGADSSTGRARGPGGHTISQHRHPPGSAVSPSAQGCVIQADPLNPHPLMGGAGGGEWRASRSHVAATQNSRNLLILQGKITYPHVWKSLCVTPGPRRGPLASPDPQPVPVMWHPTSSFRKLSLTSCGALC